MASEHVGGAWAADLPFSAQAYFIYLYLFIYLVIYLFIQWLQYKTKIEYNGKMTQ